MNLDAVAIEFGMYQRAEFRIDGRQHLGEHLHLGDGNASGGESFGHFEPDVASADDEGGRGFDPIDAGGQGKGVAHGVQQMHSVVDAEGVQAFDRWPHRHGAGPDDKLVVLDHRFTAVLCSHSEAPPADVDRGGEGVEAQFHAGGFEVGVGAVGEVAPVGDFARDVVGDAADGEVGVGVGDHDGHLSRGVEFTGSQRSGDSGVATADGNQVHGGFQGLGCVSSGKAKPGKMLSSSWRTRASMSSRMASTPSASVSAGSAIGQSSYRRPGMNGQVSPQPMVMTTSAAATTSSVSGLGNSSSRLIPTSFMAWLTSGWMRSPGSEPPVRMCTWCLAVIAGEGSRHLRTAGVVDANKENLRRSFGLHAIGLGVGVEALAGEAFSQGRQEGGDPSGLGQQGVGVMEGGDDLPGGEAVGVVVDEYFGQSIDQG